VTDPPPIPRAVLARPVVEARPVADSTTAPAPRSWQAQLESLPRRDAVLDFALILFATVLLQYGPQALLLALGAARFDVPDDERLILTGKIGELSLAGGLLAYLVLRHRLSPALFGLTTRRPLLQLAWGLAGVVCAYVAILALLPLMLLLLSLIPAFSEEISQRMEFVTALPAENLSLLAVLLTAVALHEEIVFRALMIPYLRRLTGNWTRAILLSSVLFAALHIPAQGLLGGVQILAVGISLAIVFALSRSLLAVTLAHFGFNFLQIQLVRFVQQFGEWPPWPPAG
jgi:membrane protease YdiL (CAAX protease family)